MSNQTHSAELEKAVHLALSRVLGTQGGTRVYVPNLTVIVSAVAGNQTSERRPRDVMRGLGLEPKDLDARWSVARANGNLLPRPLVAEFFPERIWPAFANAIALGPVNLWQQVEAILSCWARGFEPDGRARKQALAANTVDLYIGAVHKLMKELCELRKLAAAGQVDLDSAILDAWRAAELPARVSPAQLGAAPANRDRRAPNLRAVRLALRALDREVQRKKKTATGRRNIGRVLRNRALLGVFLTLGGRRGAIVRLRRADFVRFHRSGGHEGPALLLRPGKGLHGDLVRVKFIPTELGEWIHEWVEHAGIHDQSDAPLWPVSQKNLTPLHEQSVAVAISRALAPYVPDRRISPHTLRHLCEKLAFLSGMDWLADNRERLVADDLSGLPSNPQTFADVLLDHALSSVQDRYKDIASEHGRETWARIAAEGVWAFIWGDKGAPKGPDVELVAEARQTMKRAHADHRAAKHTLAALEAKKKVVRQQAIAQAGLVDGGITLKAMLELDELADEVAAAVGEVGAAERQLDQAREELMRARATLVPLPDEDPTPADPELLADVVVPGVDSDGEASEEEPYRREKIAPREFQWALGGPDVMADATLRRYMRGLMPHPRGDRRNLWDPAIEPSELPDCIERPSPRKTWIRIDRLDLSRYPVAVIERLKYLQTLGEDEVFAREMAAA